jgi:hypothetical protein
LILVFGQDDLVAHWMSGKIGIVFVPPFVTIGATQDGQSLCAGVLFNNWNGFNMDISLAADVLSRGAIRGVYDYAFNQTGALRLTAITRRSNRRMRDILPRLGFKHEGVSFRHFGARRSDDAFRFALFRQDAEKWIR